jgi:hypothetical protein
MTSKLQSIDCPEEVQVTYKVGEFVTPKYGKLCCFANLEDAKYFAGWYSDYVIYECEIGNRYTNPYIPRRNTWDYNIIILFEKISHLRLYNKKFSHLCYNVEGYPKGSVFTDKIKIIKEVQYEK